MLTQKDLDEIEKGTKEIVKEAIKHLPNKDDFYTRMDELVGEIKAAREEFQAHTSQHSSINDDNDELKSKVEKLITPSS